MENWEKQLAEMSNKPMPDMVENRVKQTLNNLPQKKRRPKLIYASLAAVLFLGLMVGASAISPAFGNTLKSLPLIKTVTDLIDDTGMENSFEQGMATPIGEKYIIDGKTVLFTEVIYDGFNIYIGYIVSQAPPNEQRLIINNSKTYVNGEEFGFSRSSVGEWTDEYFYAGRLKLNPIDEQLPSKFHLELELKNDNIAVDFFVEKKNDVDVYVTNQSKKQDYVRINYKSVSFTPAATIIGYDEIGSNETIHFIIQDDKGRVLQVLDSSGIGSKDLYRDTDGIRKNLWHSTVSVEPLNDKPEFLTINPYIEPKDQSSSVINMVKWENKKAILSQGELGNIIITDVVREGDDVSIYFTTTGIDEYQQGSFLELQDENNQEYYYHSTLTQVGIHQYKKTFKDFPRESDVILVSREVKDNIYLEDLEVTLPISRK